MTKNSKKIQAKFAREREVRPAFNVIPKTINQDYLMRSIENKVLTIACLLYTSPSPRDS